MWTLPGRSFRMPATDLRSILTTGRRPAGFVLNRRCVLLKIAKKMTAALAEMSNNWSWQTVRGSPSPRIAISKASCHRHCHRAHMRSSGATRNDFVWNMTPLHVNTCSSVAQITLLPLVKPKCLHMRSRTRYRQGHVMQWYHAHYEHKTRFAGKRLWQWFRTRTFKTKSYQQYWRPDLRTSSRDQD